METHFHEFPVELGGTYSVNRCCRLRGEDSMCEEVNGEEEDCAEACEGQNT